MYLLKYDKRYINIFIQFHEQKSWWDQVQPSCHHSPWCYHKATQLLLVYQVFVYNYNDHNVFCYVDVFLKMTNLMANYVHDSFSQGHLIHEQDIHFQLVLVLYCSKNIKLKLFVFFIYNMNYILVFYILGDIHQV